MSEYDFDPSIADEIAADLFVSDMFRFFSILFIAVASVLFTLSVVFAVSNHA